eukprot:917420_1
MIPRVSSYRLPGVMHRIFRCVSGKFSGLRSQTVRHKLSRYAQHSCLLASPKHILESVFRVIRPAAPQSRIERFAINFLDTHTAFIITFLTSRIHILESECGI